MAKVIGFSALFLTFSAIHVGVFFVNHINSANFLKNLLTENAKSQGFLVEIEDGEVHFARSATFFNVSTLYRHQRVIFLPNEYYEFIIPSYEYTNFSLNVGRVEVNIDAEKYFRFAVRSLFGQNTNWQDFILGVKAFDISLSIDDSPVFENGRANIHREPSEDNEGQKLQFYLFDGDIKSQNLQDLNISDFFIRGFVSEEELNTININSDFTANGAEVNIFAIFNLESSDFDDLLIRVGNLELANIFYGIGISGELSLAIKPNIRSNPHFVNDVGCFSWDFNLDFWQNIKENCFSGSVGITNFRYWDEPLNRQILDAVSFLGIHSLNFSNIVADFAYFPMHSEMAGPGAINIENFLASSRNFDIFANGQLLHGVPLTPNWYFTYNFNTEIRFSQGARSFIDRNIWSVLSPNRAGGEGRFLSAQVSGEGQNISISFEQEIFKRGVNQILSEIRNFFR